MSQSFSRPLPKFFIGKMEANTRIKNFQNSKHALLKAAIEKEETKSIWYSFQHLEDLFKELVFLNADGIRFYLGSYSSDHPDFSNQLCLIMVPTSLDSETGSHADILIEDIEGFQNRSGSQFFIKEDLKTEFKEYNYGSPCPPVCPRNGLKFPLD